MCGSMVDIQSATAEIRRGKTERKIDRKKQQDKNIMSASATQGGHKNRDAQKKRYSHKVRGVSPKAGKEYGGKDL